MWVLVEMDLDDWIEIVGGCGYGCLCGWAWVDLGGWMDVGRWMWLDWYVDVCGCG